MLYFKLSKASLRRHYITLYPTIAQRAQLFGRFWLEGKGHGSFRKKFDMSIRKTHTKPFVIPDSHTRFGIRDSGFGIRDSHTRFGIRNSGFGIRDSGFGELSTTDLSYSMR